jgi:hypothetical protein
MSAVPPHFSADGRWWWNGGQWIPSPNPAAHPVPQGPPVPPNSLASPPPGSPPASGLGPGEVTITERRVHPVAAFGLLPWVGMALALFGDFDVVEIAGWLILALSVARAALRMANVAIRITSHRIYFSTGWLHTQVDEFPMPYVATVSVRQGVLGRMMNFGTIQISGFGFAGPRLRAVSNPPGYVTRCSNKPHSIVGNRRGFPRSAA